MKPLFVLSCIGVIAFAYGDNQKVATSMAVLENEVSSVPHETIRRSSRPVQECVAVGGRVVGSKCLFVRRLLVPWASWGGNYSDAGCQIDGGRLASIVSQAEHNVAHELYLQQVWNPHLPQGYERQLWIGMWNVNGGSTWAWIDDDTPAWTQGSNAFQKWASNEPRTSQSGNAGCVAMTGSNGAWDARNCDRISPYLCELDLVSCGGHDAVSCSHCPETHGRWWCNGECAWSNGACGRKTRCDKLGGVSEQGSNKCFFVPDLQTTWREAQDTCRVAGGNLASIASAAENDLVYGLYGSSGARDANGALWIGMTDQDASAYGSSEGMWRWSDGSATDYSNWSPGEPNNWGGGQDCGAMWRNDKEWDDQGCDSSRHFVCAVRSNPACDELDGVWLDGKCFFVPDVTGTWQAGETACSSLGGHLASISSAAENDVVYGLYVSSGARDGGNAMWIGASDRAQEGSWSWSDQSSMAFQGWSQGEPNNYGGRQDCAAMWMDDRSWDDSDCNNRKPFVCSKAT